jgi:hypothetical protein
MAAKNTVRFSDTTRVISIADESDDYRLARIGTWQTVLADRLRFRKRIKEMNDAFQLVVDVRRRILTRSHS